MSNAPSELEPLFHEYKARDPRNLIIVGVALLLLGLLIYVFEASWWIILMCGLIALPAVIDLARDRRATLKLDDTHLSWESGARSGNIAITDIADAKLRTAMDVSQRATLLLHDGNRVKIPIECIPKGRSLDEAFEARRIPFRRALF